MTTNVSITLSESQLMALGKRLNGKPGPATRAQIREIAETAVYAAITGTTRKVRLQNVVCTKCGRITSVGVPV